MVTYEDVYTRGAVRQWSAARRAAWKGRAANCNECLYRLPVPGERLATGAFTDDESAAFERRLAEFRAQGWPLSCWGLFSLALPNRVGYQCSQHYAKHHGGAAGKAGKPSAAAVATCQRELAPAVAAAFAAPAAKRTAAAVDRWLAEAEAEQMAAGALHQPVQPPTLALKRQQQQQQQPHPFAAMQPRPPPQQPFAAQQLQEQHAVAPRPAVAGQKRQQPPPVAATAAVVGAKKARPAAKAASHSKNQRIRASGDGSSSENEFVPGSLKHTAMPVLPAVLPAPQASKKASGKGRRGAGAAAATAAAAAAPEGFGERVEVLRLDTTKPSRWPGWQASVVGIRRVAPYQPATGSATGAASQPGSPAQQQQPAAGSAVVHTADLLSYDLDRLGVGFLGVLLQLGDSLLPNGRAALPAAAHSAGMEAAAGETAASQALSWQRLAACLRLGDGALPCGLVCVWASKAAVAPAIRLLGALGCKYVENLTWVQLGPDNKPLARPGPLFNSSHATLLVGRRGDEKKAHLELRHQRTPDVVISPALRPGACPDAVYSMIETLLPDVGAAARSGGRLRLLELVFPPAAGLGPGGRPGWITVVQAQGAVPD
ncbi:hypothetical protein ABPG75_002184 [Micractinium tetrahymenae]